jgi:hypothetical protein
VLGEIMRLPEAAAETVARSTAAKGMARADAGSALAAVSGANSARVEARLRRLGYIE